MASDIFIHAVPTDMVKKSQVKFDAKIFDDFNNGNSAWILNPKILTGLYHLPNFSMAVGLRHAVGETVLGHHIFVNFDQAPECTYFQMGNALDFFVGNWESHINYYFPKKYNWKDVFFVANCNEKVEAEVHYKTPLVKIGASNEWNISKKINTISFKTDIPFYFFSVGSKVSYNRKDRFSYGISFSYHFYRSPKHSKKSSEIKYNPKPKITYKSLHQQDNWSRELQDFFNNKSEKIDSIVIKDINYKKIDKNDLVIKKD